MTIGPTRVSADAETLMKQAGYTAEVYMLDAIQSIDKIFGEGFAKKHSDLVGRYMMTAALDYVSAAIQIAGQTIEAGLECADNSSAIGDVSSSLSEMAEKVQNIAAMLDMHSCGKPSS